MQKNYCKKVVINMEYGLLEFLQGVELEGNPNAALHLMIFVIVMAILVGMIYVLNRLPEIQNKLRDERLYKFILEFKNLSEDDLEIVDEIIKKYEIKSKYKLLVMESIFDKYIEKEIMGIEGSSIDIAEKKLKIDKLKTLKNILFR